MYMRTSADVLFVFASVYIKLNMTSCWGPFEGGHLFPVSLTSHSSVRNLASVAGHRLSMWTHVWIHMDIEA